jgi:peptidoglycan/xylan/chitin deacetylase (PgdA/CDA1 family)
LASVLIHGFRTEFVSMRTPKVLLLGLALGVLTGCGTTVTASPAAAPSRSSVAPARSGKARPAAPKQKPVQRRAKAKPAQDQPKPDKPRRVQRRTGPANSVMRTGRAGVALTFDDGPDPVQTPRLLNLLKKQHVKATFCVVGRNVAAYPGLVRRIAAEGHTLCNHTWAHSLTLGRKKPAVIRADLLRTNKAIQRAVPGVKIKYMRAPGGNFTPAFVRVATGLKMKSIYWQVDPRDWEHPKGETGPAHRAKVTRTIKTHVGKGAIVLSHDYRQPETIAAYTKLLPWLKKRYRLIALP